jgi:hypothetical protein
MTDDRRTEACPRTSHLIDRVLRDGVTDDDRTHAASCERCDAILTKAARFDDDLRRAARDLVGEELPRGVFDPGLVRQVGPGWVARRVAPGLAGILAAIAVLLVATSVALAPGGRGGASASVPPQTGLGMQLPVLRQRLDIIPVLQGRDYSCRPGSALPSPATTAGAPVREGVLCYSPKTDAAAAVWLATRETEDARVVEIEVDGKFLVTPVAAVRQELAGLLGFLAETSISDPETATAAAEFVETKAIELRATPLGDGVEGVFGEVRITLDRLPDRTYRLVLRPVGAP